MVNMRTIRVGTRGSKLALWQANYVIKELEKWNPGLHFKQVIIKTEGDIDQKSSLTKIGGQGIFTKELENALLNEKIDVAVHSLKDLPSKMADSLKLGAVPPRGPVEDILISEHGLTLQELPNKARVATGSIRRKSQLLSRRPDLIISDLRGNIDTRIKKLKEQNISAIIMAKAAVIRLNIEDARYTSFSPDEMIPAVGQGAIGIQIRKEDADIQKLVDCVNHEVTYYCVSAERALLFTLDSGCQFPVGGHANIRNKQLHLSGFVGSEDGREILHETIETSVEDFETAGISLAGKLIERGATSLLENIKTD
jgi:hydroxymethylbilane synthase